MSNSPLVSTGWLAERLGDPAIVVVDGSYYLPTMNRDAAAEYATGHIPGAVRFDIDTVKDRSNPLPHMLPPPDEFARAVGDLGIGDDTTVVIYDGAGLFAAPRVWWTFRVMGARDVRILDGGFPAWKAEGRPIEMGPAASRPARKFTPRFDSRAVADLTGVQAALAGGTVQVVDARPAERFRGEMPEPRPGLASGHMPGALSVPYTTLIRDGRLAPPEDLAKALAAGGVDVDRPVLPTCGSGVSAATIWLALEMLGRTPFALYDGSWSEWGARKDLPVATGPA